VSPHQGPAAITAAARGPGPEHARHPASWYVEPSDQPPGYRDIPFDASHPKMHSAWHVFDAEALYWAPRHLQLIWGASSIFITENGCAATDVNAEDGRVYDSDRVMFLRAYSDSYSERPPRASR
jgi:beta-glucosidase/6-phospho-beta-glucosidase/beta-galactosidase